MTYNQYRMIFYVSFTAFAIMLIASIVILIVLLTYPGFGRDFFKSGIGVVFND